MKLGQWKFSHINQCTVINHTPVCACLPSFTGDPFTQCQIIQAPPTPTQATPSDPCFPSPCGSNARCRVQNEHAVCECLPDYYGNAYEGCRPECLINSDCPLSLACIKNHCRDPCPGTCGVQAVCSVSNHIPICYCPEGFTGDAFRQCSPIPKPVPEYRDPCASTQCGLNAFCQVINGAAQCSCLPGYFGSPLTTGCRLECVINSDCPRNRACVNNKCVDPCANSPCGYRAQCDVINHSPVCSCPAPLQGDPFVLCKEVQEEPRDPCNPSPCGQNGVCRVINGLPSCTYPECVINPDCPRDRACVNQRCRDTCPGSCGLNAICTMINHGPVCSCPPSWVGDPRVQCLVPQQDPPKPECVTNSDCPNDKACINSWCKSPCADGVCAPNAQCSVQFHRPICSCRDGLTGDANVQCYEIGCRADSECPPTQSCVNRQCVDPCSYTTCGTNALCRVDYNHRARCYCPETYFGNPQIRCERPQCLSNDECPAHLACVNQRCADPCDCAPGAQCQVMNHWPQCSCPPGYVGNPKVSCTLAPLPPSPQCTMDGDCGSRLACFSGSCRNPCEETKPCGPHATCSVVDSLPLRTMTCLCAPGYVGDADVACVLAEEPTTPGCTSNDQCASSEVCINRLCVNPCQASNPCAPSAQCTASAHRAQCVCPPGLVGDPFVNCYQVPQQSPECVSDSQCPSTLACINSQCQDPCVISQPCGISAQCLTLSHRPTCHCPDGWAGNPQQACYRPECKVDSDCLYDKACHHGSCVNPCVSTSCGRGAQCIAQAHRGLCTCPPGTQGDAQVACVPVGCQYNEDCADHEACDRLNRACRPVCDTDTCAVNAVCTASHHQPSCNCLPGYQGNAYVQCTEARSPLPPAPECTSDSQCPSQTACINEKCANPCALGRMCSPDQECRVSDTVPLRTLMCVCPPDTVASSDGLCRRILPQPQCKVDHDCADPDRCVQGSCIEACRIDSCGLNAQCISRGHQARCTCPPGYVGNAHIECTFPQQSPPLPPVPECTRNDDCPYGLGCVNTRCVNPCASDVCAPSAFCHAEQHQAVCRCPAGYTGDPRIRCTPPSVATSGCTSNTECTQSEICVNRLCVSPCNCGPNADCNVVNHYPSCQCKLGYHGNPLIGCVPLGCESDEQCGNAERCYNGQCVNPCIVDNVCAVNAECYADNHRAMCRCPVGYIGSAYERCERVECQVDTDCPLDKTCQNTHCVNPCTDAISPPCANNALCYVRNHLASCRCPEHTPLGNPLTYCERTPLASPEPECRLDRDCPSQHACINSQCVNPCIELSPCARSARCEVLDSLPVRTMVCTCPEGWVPDNYGECKPVIIPPPGCVADSECPSNQTCMNRMCRDPCDCGPNAQCYVSNHRPVCSCIPGYDGNPNIGCKSIGCRTDSECESGRACVNGACINPCLVRDPCGPNAECFAVGSRADCRCVSGYRGNPFERCFLVGCHSNSDCPSDRACINSQCINPCVYDHPCAPLAECTVQNHQSLCRCPVGYQGNPYTACRPEPQPECKLDTDCPSLLACLNARCVNPCTALRPCDQPAQCTVLPTPVRTMLCECPPGYVSSGSGTCKPTPPITAVGCTSDEQCPSDRACVTGRCISPCHCAPDAECHLFNHKPVCSCPVGYVGNAELQCVRAGCRADSDCAGTQACVNRNCVAACAADGSSCGTSAECYGVAHRAVCECPPGTTGNANVACIQVECRADSDCVPTHACINTKCRNPCAESNPCTLPAECSVFNHRAECLCPPGYVGDARLGCEKINVGCRSDSECPSQTACINAACVNPCKATEPCGIHAECKVFDTLPVRTMICECEPGYQGNAAVQCDKIPDCQLEKGYIIDVTGACVCPPGFALNERDECRRCIPELGFKIDEQGRCVCDLTRGLIINERGECTCPEEHGYRLDIYGNCILLPPPPECSSDYECADNRFCNLEVKKCEDPCLTQVCGVNAFCNATNHRAYCQCISGYVGDAYIFCNATPPIYRDVFPKPEIRVVCLADGIQVDIHNTDQSFSGVLYVKGHSNDEQCRKIVSQESTSVDEVFKVNFGECGLIHVNGEASFILVIQKHPQLVTYKAQAYHIKCVYATKEQNVTLGFNVSMLTTAGTIANTGPPPTCLMKIVTKTGQEINSATVGDNLMLQVDVQPNSIYGGFARSCIAKTIENNVENEYIVTDENGCATDPSIFGDWSHDADSQSLLAPFNAFKFPSSDNIRFQCNIRVCFGRCQPVNCRGYDAYGKRRRRDLVDITQRRNQTADVMETAWSGQLREEITIESNPILTFEPKEGERYTNPMEEPIRSQLEDICISIPGLIVALIITALLALVAVAIAVSCWLLAYRRPARTTGPLPHPPEFPNPLFSHPEPVAEPTPDYLL
uniref:Neurogenic locus notch homolog protein 1 n=1 Tax=Cacopsylla melanoneura TaxID=428564 RepID=A0A8D8TXE6_9HEMI